MSKPSEIPGDTPVIVAFYEEELNMPFTKPGDKGKRAGIFTQGLSQSQFEEKTKDWAHISKYESMTFADLKKIKEDTGNFFERCE